ncbi:MAG: hypothetical protein KF823_07245 [Xanthomonadales bacterium]|nr:hypothetical protein [Xanthomonadales bacterium]
MTIRAIAITLLTAAGWSSLGAQADATQAESLADCLASVEAVYQAARIWPDENPGPRPDASAHLQRQRSQEQARDLPLMAGVLQQRYGLRITAGDVQRELDRMAQQSVAPDRLAALFAALDDDPQRAARCLAWPHLVRTALDEAVHADDQLQSGPREAAQSALLRPLDQPPPDARVERRRFVTASQAPAWRDGTSADTLVDATFWPDLLAPFHPGQTCTAPGACLNGPARPVLEETRHGWQVIHLESASEDEIVLAYWQFDKRSSDETWAVLRRSDLAPVGPPSGDFSLQAPLRTQGTTDAGEWLTGWHPPAGRIRHSTVWTGTELVVWGGWRFGVHDDGGRYDRTLDRWTPIPPDAVAGLREDHTAVWTGTQMIVWGGRNEVGDPLDSGAAWDPATGAWTALPLAGAPSPRHEHAAVWSGEHMYVWGGRSGTTVLANGAVFDPSTWTWSPLPSAGAPQPRNRPAVVWAGDRLVVLAGSSPTGGPGPFMYGASLDPDSSAWIPLPAAGAMPGEGQAAVWTGTELIVWGGHFVPVGARWTPGALQWTPMSTVDAPSSRDGHAMVWTGDEVLVWSGRPIPSGIALRDGGRYRPDLDTWTPIPYAPTTIGRRQVAAVWTGTEMMFWGGSPLTTILDSGARFDPTTANWTALPGGDGPWPRVGHASVWTGAELVIWGDDFGRTGMRFDPATFRWQQTTSIGAPGTRIGMVGAWTGSEVLVWGGGGPPTNVGGRYRPDTDTWHSMNATGSPLSSRFASGAWTGTELLVWGGGINGQGSGAGGRYHADTDTWQMIAPGPPGRWHHASAWTGDALLVWGGIRSRDTLADGFIYSPASDQWQPLPYAGSPGARNHATGVWTGEGFMVWGGLGPDGSELGDGAFWRPGDDAWSTLPGAGAPSARWGHTATWTGDSVVVWGGFQSDQGLADGARLAPSGDRWLPISPTNAPTARGAHAATWLDGVDLLAVGGGYDDFLFPAADMGLYQPPSELLFANGFESGTPDSPVVPR